MPKVATRRILKRVATTGLAVVIVALAGCASQQPTQVADPAAASPSPTVQGTPTPRWPERPLPYTQPQCIEDTSIAGSWECTVEVTNTLDVAADIEVSPGVASLEPEWAFEVPPGTTTSVHFWFENEPTTFSPSPTGIASTKAQIAGETDCDILTAKLRKYSADSLRALSNDQTAVAELTSDWSLAVQARMLELECV